MVATGACEVIEGAGTAVYRPRSREALRAVVQGAAVLSHADLDSMPFWLRGPVKDAILAKPPLPGGDCEQSATEVDLSEIAVRLTTDRSAKIIRLNRHDPIVMDHCVEDMVVTVSGNESLANLDLALRKAGQCLPHAALATGDHRHSITAAQTIEHAIGMNFPHALEAQHGSWRDWVLGMTLLLADGTIAKSGSRVVKSVAGYDVHKLFVGARGTLGIILDVTLRTVPTASLSSPDLVFGSDVGHESTNWIQRTLPSDFESALRAAGKHLVCADRASATVWAALPREIALERLPHDWVLSQRLAEQGFLIHDPVQRALVGRAQEIFDPTKKLNPGALGTK